MRVQFKKGILIWGPSCRGVFPYPPYPRAARGDPLNYLWREADDGNFIQ